MMHDTRQLFPGYDIHVYPLYTEFVAKKDYPVFKKFSYDTSLDVPVKIRNKRQAKKDGMTYQRFDTP
ncbi:MAG: hypothetical protein V6Z89_15275, partial [Desulfobacter sp.]